MCFPKFKVKTKSETRKPEKYELPSERINIENDSNITKWHIYHAKLVINIHEHEKGMCTPQEILDKLNIMNNTYWINKPTMGRFKDELQVVLDKAIKIAALAD